ncbi:MAG: o-succinylbenzoate synthase [Chloroflexota bacterium]
MKIVRADVYLLDLELRTPFTTSFGTATVLRRPYVLLRTDDGRRGLGEIPTLPDPAYKAEVDHPAVLTSLERFVLPSAARAQRERGGIADVAGLRASYAWIKGAVFAKSGVEAAFWDLLAQREGAPLWRMWGGTRRSFPVGVSIGGKTLDQVLALADNAVSLGFQRLKVKIWPGFDLEPARALRERFPGIMLQVDANSAYDLSNWERLKGLDGLDLLLIEQPLYDDDLYFHSLISREIRTPLCLDESVHSLRDAEVALALWGDLAADRLVINIKPPRVSGFSEAIAIAERCAREGVRTWIGGMLDSAWGKAMNLNLNTLEAITLPGDHFSPGGIYFVEDLTTSPLSCEAGVFTIGDGVSAGVEIDWERFDRLAEKQFSVEFSG